MNLNESRGSKNLDIPDMIMDTESRMILDSSADVSAELGNIQPLGTSVATDDSGVHSDEGAPTFKKKCIDKLERV